MCRQSSAPIAGKAHAQAATKYAFIGGHPLDAEFLRDGKRFLRDASLRRPDSDRTNSEDFFVEVKSAQKLLARIFRTAEAIVRHRQSGAGDCSGVGVTDERKNRMVERGRGDLRASALCGGGVRGQYFGEQLALVLNDEVLLVTGEAAALLDDPGHFGLIEKKLVEPGNLREHLQVREVLRLKVALGFFWSVPGALHPLPEFPISRITSDQVLRIGLKQIAKAKAALGAGEVGGGFGGNTQKRILRRAGNIILNLRDERWDEVKGLMNIGKFVQQFDHSVIVF